MSEEPAKRERRKPGPVTRDYLFRAAVHYLERYASSSGNLARVLERKILRRARERGEDPAAFLPLVEETVAKVLDLKLIDDAAFAEAKVASLRRRGASKAQLNAKLAAKGVDRDTAAAAMAADETDEADAARAYARRRRLGPHRLRDRTERRDRDVAAMMRQGFSFALASATIDGEADDPLAG